MNIRITLVSLLLFIIPYWINYIQGQISGIVIDRKGFPIPYANVSVLSAGDSLFVKGGVADSTGHFQITDMEPDKPYMLRLSSVGYKTRPLSLYCRKGAHLSYGRRQSFAG